jgi:hypothetical protein
MRQISKEYKAGSVDFYGTITPIEEGNVVDCKFLNFFIVFFRCSRLWKRR